MPDGEKKTPFPPLALPGQNIAIRFHDGHIEYYQVLSYDSVPGILITVAGVAAGGTSSFTDTSDDGKLLLPNDKREQNLHQLIQYRILPLTNDSYVEVYQPRDMAKWVLANTTAKVYRLSDISDYERFWTQFYGSLTEFYVLNERATFKIVVGNLAGSAQDIKLLFLGWKFLLKRLEEPPAKFTQIQIGPTLPIE